LAVAGVSSSELSSSELDSSFWAFFAETGATRKKT